LNINELHDIPCLPISFFKGQNIQTGRWKPTHFFESSGTTGQKTSRNAVRNMAEYLENTRRGFEPFFGKLEDWTILALLPGYLERGGSSLVAMTDFFIQKTGKIESGFYLNELEKLAKTLEKLAAENRKTMLIGVSFALLDLAEMFEKKLDLSKIHVVETGGMKGRRREITRPELHEILRNSLKIKHIHSEYGMTELLSQGWSIDGEPFAPAPTMRVFAKEINDPFVAQILGKSGQISVIDLANLDTCAFIATEDVGRVFTDGRFEILGRLDVAEMRGCNLMVE
jgi:phenylacetate-coenzyme A ligase PaaK-like adenylate-forming protein